MVTPGQLNRRAAFFEQLAAMIAAGVTLTQALEMAARNRTSGIPPRFLQTLIAHLQAGHTFTDSLQLASGQKRRDPTDRSRPARSYWLSDFDVALLSAGEESGRLDTTFKLLARYYAARAKLIRDTISGSLVTIVTLHVFLLVFPIGLLQGFVVGIMDNRYGQCLPFLLEKAAVFGLLYGSVWLLAFASQGNRGEVWRAGIESVFSRIPGLATALKSLVVARLAMALDALLSAGVPVIRSWELAVGACGSPALKKQVLQWTPQLEHGTTPAEMVSQIRYFPDLFAQLYHTGEISGKQDETLTRLHTYYEEEGFRKLQTFSRILMYTIYFSIAILIGLFVIRFWTGYFNTMLNAI